MGRRSYHNAMQSDPNATFPAPAIWMCKCKEEESSWKKALLLGI